MAICCVTKYFTRFTVLTDCIIVADSKQSREAMGVECLQTGSFMIVVVLVVVVAVVYFQQHKMEYINYY